MGRAGYADAVGTTILVPLDESPWADAALHTAIRLARAKPDDTLLLGLHVVGVTHLSGHLLRDLAGLLGFEPVLVPEHVELVYRRQGRKLLDRFEELCAAEGVRHRALLETGAVLARLLHHASTADLVVMGARGERELTNPGSGGTLTERFVRASPVSVLCTGREPLQFRGVTVGYDGSDGAQCALREVRHLLERVDVSCRVAYVVDERRKPDFDPLPEAVKSLARHDIGVDTIRLDGEPHEALAADVEDTGHDLLVLGFRGQSRLRDLLLGRVTERVMRVADVALLIAR